jgi:L-2-hydroxyglutarate oxidase
MYEMYRSYSKAAFTKALQRLIRDSKEDLEIGSAGVRAQGDSKGNLSMIFFDFENKTSLMFVMRLRQLYFILAIGESIASLAL